jgi:8-oxo-dGTP diphosphatase
MAEFHLVGWLIVRREAAVLLARRSGVSYGDGHWGLPGGHVEDGETLAAAACREAREEVGIHTDPADLTAVGMSRYTDDGMAGLDLFFQTARFTGRPSPLSECDQVGWFELGRLPEPVLPWLPSTLHRLLIAGEWYEESLDELPG